MALYLVQHGKSLPKHEDPNQGLAREGLAETKAIAQLAAENNVQPMRIVHSGKKRALQTAEILVKALEPEAGVIKGAGLAPLDDVKIFAATISKDEDIMVVGHLPFLERLVSYLVAGSAERPVVKFRNSAMVCLDNEDPSQPWFISWALYPRLD